MMGFDIFFQLNDAFFDLPLLLEVGEYEFIKDDLAWAILINLLEDLLSYGGINSSIGIFIQEPNYLI